MTLYSIYSKPQSLGTFTVGGPLMIKVASNKSLVIAVADIFVAKTICEIDKTSDTYPEKLETALIPKLVQNPVEVFLIQDSTAYETWSINRQRSDSTWIKEFEATVEFKGETWVLK